MWPQWPAALGSLQSAPQQCGHIHTCRANRWCQGQSASPQKFWALKKKKKKCRALWYTGEPVGDPRGRGAPWCWQRWRGWPPSPSHTPSLSRLSQLQTGVIPAHCPPQPKLPKIQERPLFFFAALGLPCGEHALPCCRRVFSVVASRATV